MNREQISNASNLAKNRKQLADSERLSLTKVNAIITDFVNGVPANEALKKHQIGHLKQLRIIDWYLAELKQSKKMVEMERRYYKDEDEMLIQDYKVEDLKGDELEILNNLK